MLPGWCEFLDLNHVGDITCPVSLMIAKFAPEPKPPSQANFAIGTLISRSSKAEHPADNRKTAVRYRAGEPEALIEQEDHYDHQRNGAACRRISTAMDPERSSLRWLGNGLLIRAPRGSTPAGSPNTHD